MQLNHHAIAGLLVLAGLLPGCATIVQGGSQNVTVETNPPGATCAVDRMGQRLGMVAPTPGTVRIDKSKNDLAITCTKDGFRPASIAQTPSFGAATLGNIIAGGVIGVVVDAASGANYTYPADVKLELSPAGWPLASNGPGM